jgi:hypothetical protein
MIFTTTSLLIHSVLSFFYITILIKYLNNTHVYIHLYCLMSETI